MLMFFFEHLYIKTALIKFVITFLVGKNNFLVKCFLFNVLIFELLFKPISISFFHSFSNKKVNDFDLDYMSSPIYRCSFQAQQEMYGLMIYSKYIRVLK